MRIAVFLAGLLLAAGAFAATPEDFASRWKLAADRPGAYALVLDAGVYAQATRADLADLAVFNADGQELAFGPLPARTDAPASEWRDAAWFALPSTTENPANADLQLYVRRATDGSLTLDSTLAAAPAGHAPAGGVQDLLIDVRAARQSIAGLDFTFAEGAADFSAAVDVQASDDLRSWRSLATDVPLASLHQGAARLLRNRVEFEPQPATYLRVHASRALPIETLRQLQLAPGSTPPWLSMQAVLARRDGNTFYYRLPARIPVQRLAIDLGDANATARLRVAVRDADGQDWRDLGDFDAFSVRSAGVALDAAPLDIAQGRWREWRVQADPQAALARAPHLRLDYRPERWIVLTHGAAPYTLYAGSRRAQRSPFPLASLMASLRSRYGADWQPLTIGHESMDTAAGAAALHGWDAHQGTTWLLWLVLGLGALAVAVLAILALRSAGKADR